MAFDKIELQRIELFRRNQLVGEEFSYANGTWGIYAKLYGEHIEINKGDSSLVFSQEHIHYVNAINNLWAKRREKFVGYVPYGGLWHGEPRILFYPRGSLEDSDAKVLMYQNKVSKEEWNKINNEIDFPIVKPRRSVEVNGLKLKASNLLVDGKKVGEEYKFLDFVARAEKFRVYYKNNREKVEDARYRYNEGFKYAEETELLKEIFDMWQTRRGSYAKWK